MTGPLSNEDYRSFGLKGEGTANGFAQEVQHERLDSSGWGFAVRACSIIDLSDTGMQISVSPADPVPSIRTVVMSRTASGRRTRVVWRRGSQIGAEFK
jgi:hypothetical protein